MSGQPTGRQRAFRGSLLVLVQLVLLVGALELGGRVYASRTDQPRGTDFHPEYGWKAVPNIQKVGPNWSGKGPGFTNAMGWRDADHGFERPASIATRILLLGDSMAWGSGVDYGDRFSELLEDSESGVEVVNLAVFAYAVDQELRVFEEEGRLYQPDVVLLGLSLATDLGEIQDRTRYGFPKPYFILGEDDSLTRVDPVQDFTVRLRTASYLVEYALRLAGRGEESRSVPTADASPALPLMRALLMRLSDVATRSGARLLVILMHPSEEPGAETAASFARIGAMLNEAGIAVLDTGSPFRTARSAGRDVHIEGGHWSASGHRLAADLIRSDLEARGWLESGR